MTIDSSTTKLPVIPLVSSVPELAEAIPDFELNHLPSTTHKVDTELEQALPLVENQPPSQSSPGLRWQVLQVFGSTFVTIFLAELGDKTQVTTLLMAAESHQPWIIFLGAGSALVLTSLLGVLLGQWLATRLSQKTLETSAGLVLLMVSIFLFWEVIHG